MLGLGMGAMVETFSESFILVSTPGWVLLWSWEVEGPCVRGGGAGPGGGASTGSDSVPSAMFSREDVEVVAGSSWIVTFCFFPLVAGWLGYGRKDWCRQSHVWIWLWY